jgi:hypothetical protein
MKEGAARCERPSSGDLRLPCGCFARAGCLTLLILVAGIAALVLLMGTRSSGPHYSNGTYSVAGNDRRVRQDHISQDAARRFDEKLAVNPDPATLLRLQIAGLDFTEEEVNSRLAAELLQQPVDAGGLHVERVFLALHVVNSTAYVYGTYAGFPVTLSSNVLFSVSNGQGIVQIDDPHAGRLPIGLVLPQVLDWTGNTGRLQRLLALALPPQVTAIVPREGMLHVTVDLRRGLDNPSAGAYEPAPLPGSSITSGVSPVGAASGLSPSPVPAAFVRRPRRGLGPDASAA